MRIHGVEYRLIPIILSYDAKKIDIFTIAYC